MDDELKKLAARLITNMIAYFWSHTAAIIKGYGNRSGWTKKDCPLNNGDGHFINSQMIYGLGKKDWKCELCNHYEFMDLEDL